MLWSRFPVNPIRDGLHQQPDSHLHLPVDNRTFRGNRAGKKCPQIIQHVRKPTFFCFLFYVFKAYQRQKSAKIASMESICHEIVKSEEYFFFRFDCIEFYNF